MYTLMNKNNKLIDFDIIGTGEMELCVTVKQYADLPAWMDGPNEWLNDRSKSASKHRAHIAKILEKCNAQTKSGFIRLTHCLSLNDTLWVKTDTDNACWDELSLYSNPFDETIARLAFDGNGLYGEYMSTTIPEATTNGNYDKCWIRENGQIQLLKAGMSGASNAGREPYGEVLASPIYRELCGGTEYELRKYHGRTVSCCNLFTDEKYGFKSAAACGMGRKDMPQLLAEYARYGCEDSFRGMIVADAVAVNSDRHYGNFGFMIDNDTLRITTPAPVFDYNLALFPYADWYEGFNDMDTWMKEHKPCIGGSYYSAADAVMTPHLRSKLINLKDLELEVKTDEIFSEERLEIINSFKNTQIDRLLGNRKQFSFAAIRRKHEQHETHPDKTTRKLPTNGEKMLNEIEQKQSNNYQFND